MARPAVDKLIEMWPAARHFAISLRPLLCYLKGIFREVNRINSKIKNGCRSWSLGIEAV
jgi:hypothetical protein